MVRRSGMWDAAWYLANNPDVAQSGQDPFHHYIVFGSREGRSPGPAFDAFSYRLLNPSAARHPLVHFLRRSWGRKSGNSPLSTFEDGHPVLSTGWFDPEWYRAQRAKYIAPGVHPYVDYVHFGEHAGFAPSPMLDLSSLPNSDPVPDGYSCHLDWLVRTGHVKDRSLKVVSQGSLEAAGRALISPRIGRNSEVAQKVVAYVHAFYPELLPEALGMVAHLPTDTSLVVAVPDHVNVRAVNRAIDSILGSTRPRIVHVTANRGRNFGPFVSDLAPIILDHDIVLHLHTKKSVYTGRERDEWRHHLYSSLAGTRLLVDTVLGLFADEPNVGVLSPSTHESLPHWAHHWLSNVPSGRQLYERLGLDPSMVGGQVDYPVGGMFWARVDALRPLLETGFKIEDFPTEPAPNDGTLAHAIERSLFDVARSRGFDFVEFDQTLPQWRLNWSGRLPLPTRDELEVGLAKSIDAARLISVDLFDTLVLRPSLNPSSLQRLVAARIARECELDPSELLGKRLDAENLARSQVMGDVTLDDIRAAAPSSWNAAVSAQLDAEVELEFEMCVARTWLVDTLRQSKRSDQIMVLMTDTYLPRWCIDRLLKMIHAEELFDDIFVSNQVRARKDSGALWNLVEASYGISRTEWVHIGDNEFSDVQQPVDRGIGVVHMPSPGARADSIGASSRHARKDQRWATDLVVGLAATDLFEGGAQGDQSSAFRFGWCGLGPFLWTYVSWLIGHPALRESDRLFFVARDGYLPMKVVEHLRSFLPDWVPPSAYLLTSRRSALSVAQGNGARLDLVLEGGEWKGNLRNLVRVRIGVELPEDPALDLDLELPDEIDIAMTRLDPYRDALVERGLRDLQVYQRYLKHVGLAESDRCVIADLGYSGTIQRCLETVLPNEFVGLYAATSPRARLCAGEVHGLFGEDVDWPDNRNVVLDNGLLLEALWQADHGQVIRIGFDDTGLFALLKSRDPISDTERQQLRDAQAGALAFCRDVVDRFGPDLLSVPVDPQVGSIPFAHLVSGHVSWANGILAQLKIDNEFMGLGQSRVRHIPR